MQLFAIALLAASPLAAHAAAVPSSSSSSSSSEASSSTSSDPFAWRQVGCVATSSKRIHSPPSSSSASASGSSAPKPDWTEHCLDRCGALSTNPYALVLTSPGYSRCACPEEVPEDVRVISMQLPQCAEDDAVLYVRETIQSSLRSASISESGTSSWHWPSFGLTSAVNRLFSALLPSAPESLETASNAAQTGPIAAPAPAAPSTALPIIASLEARAESLRTDIHDLLISIAAHELAFRQGLITASAQSSSASASHSAAEKANKHNLRVLYILEEQLEEVMKERRRVKRAMRRLLRIEQLGLGPDVLRAVEEVYVGPLVESWRAADAPEPQAEAVMEETEQVTEESWSFQPLAGRYGRKRQQ